MMLMKKTEQYQKIKTRDNRTLDLMVLPGFILVLIFCYLPMIGVIMAFKNFNPNLGIFGSEWIGFDNFKFFFMSDDFGLLMRNTLGYSVIFLITGNIASIIFAVLCYNIRSTKLLKFYQTTAILPTFMSMVLVSYIVYVFLSPTSGVLNTLLSFFGKDSISWYSESKYWPVILTITNLWKGAGYSSLLYYSTIVGIDESLFEAAKIDGAGRLKQITHIIIPELASLICLQIIMGLGNALGGDFGLFYQVPRNVGLLYDTTNIFNTYVFRALQKGTSMGRTAAIGLFQSVVGVILLLGSNTIIKKIDSEKSMF